MRLSQPVIVALLVIFAGAGLAAQVPRPSPDFVINLPDGKQLPLKQFRGKVVALTFISTSCQHCQTLTGALNTIQAEYGPRGVQVLECAMDDNAKAEIGKFIAQFRPKFPTGWNDGATVLTYLGISVMTPGYVPKMVFIDRKGIIRGQFAGDDGFFKEPESDKNIRAKLDELLKGAPAAAAKKAAPKKPAAKR